MPYIGGAMTGTIKQETNQIVVVTSTISSYLSELNLQHPVRRADNWTTLFLCFGSVEKHGWCHSFSVLIHTAPCVQQPCRYVMVYPHHNMHLPILPAFLIRLAIKVWADPFWQLTICKTGSTGFAVISHFS